MNYQGTTPTFSFTLPESVDLTLGSSHTLTFSYPETEQVILEKSEDDLDISEHQISVFLTQEETFLMPKRVKVQLNWLYQDGAKVRRACSAKKVIPWDTNLKKEVME